ncbi:ClpB C-terminal D2-small domain-containing protein [Balamuthia mandrillaris]
MKGAMKSQQYGRFSPAKTLFSLNKASMCRMKGTTSVVRAASSHWHSSSTLTLCRASLPFRGCCAPYSTTTEQGPGEGEITNTLTSTAPQSAKKLIANFVTDDNVKPLLPKEIVSELDKYIIGQQEAKRAVAVALRNRWRRRQLPQEQAAEIIPKNILMIGPTGVGKTELARRLAKLSQAPFIKVEATKFTEVGFHGRDVDQIIRDLVENAINDATQRAKEEEKTRLKQEVEERILDLLTGKETRDLTRESFRKMLKEGKLETREVELDVVEKPTRRGLSFSENMLMQDILINVVPPKKQLRRMTVAECRPYLEEQESEKLLNKDLIVKKALDSVQNNGIVFIDEIDKICTSPNQRFGGADASSEGVQRDLLPLIEGTIINTKHGNVDTSKILFVGSGAFHSCKPSDLLAELQGRLPIRVQLKPLSREDLYRILTETHFNQIEQAKALLRTEGIDLQFTDAAIREIARLTSEVNETVENIGARRLHTVLEKILEEVSYECPQSADGEELTKVIIDVPEVEKRLSDMLIKTDLSKYVL